MTYVEEAPSKIDVAGPPSDAAGLVWEDKNTFRVHSRAYTDPNIFKLEMDRVFGATWIFVGHESEVRNAGNYKTAFVGLQPVIVSRAEDGQIHVFFNRCRHRGSVVCREPRGTANYFRCPYHGWVYGNDGRLVGVSLREGAYEDFNQPEGLQKVPRVEIYRGLIFVCLNSEAPSLIDHLGIGRDWIDRKFDMSPVGEIELRSKPYVVTYKGNWKFQAENIIDGYHFEFVHESFMKLQVKYGDKTGDYGAHREGNMAQQRKSRYEGYVLGTGQGHGLSETAATDGKMDAMKSGEFGEYFRELEKIHGRERFSQIAGNNSAMIYPNFGLIHHQLRMARPVAPDLTEVTTYIYSLVGAPEEYNNKWMHSQERFYGPAGYGMPDDVEMFALNQQGLQASAVDWLILERGLHRDVLLPSGDYRGMSADETPMRAMWRQWRRLMNGGAS